MVFDKWLWAQTINSISNYTTCTYNMHRIYPSGWNLLLLSLNGAGGFLRLLGLTIAFLGCKMRCLKSYTWAY
jgi:hypothetical protein